MIKRRTIVTMMPMIYNDRQRARDLEETLSKSWPSKGSLTRNDDDGDALNTYRRDRAHCVPGGWCVSVCECKQAARLEYQRLLELRPSYTLLGSPVPTPLLPSILLLALGDFHYLFDSCIYGRLVSLQHLISPKYSPPDQPRFSRIWKIDRNVDRSTTLTPRICILYTAK